MSTVPTVVSPNLAPRPEINPGQAGKPGAVMAGAADQLAQSADFMMQVTERVKRAQDDGIMLGAENSITADMEKAQAGLANWTDYTNADKLKQDTATALQEKYADKYSNRPDLWRHIQPYLGRELNSYNGVVDKKTAQLTASFNQGALSDSLNNTENEAATEPTIEGKQRIWGIGFDKIDVMVQNGTLWPHEAETMKKSLVSRTIATEVDRAANPMNAPEIMEAEMARLKEYEGKDFVDPKELASMQEHLGEAYKVASSRFDEKGIAKQGDAVIASLGKDPTVKDSTTGDIDYLAAAKKVDSDPSIPTKVKKYVREEFEQRDTVQKRITNETNQKALDDLAPRLYDTQKPLTSAEVKQRALLAPSEPGYIPRAVESHLLTTLGQMQRENRAQGIQERALLRQEAEQKSREMAYDLLLNSGSFLQQSDLTPHILKGLSKSDAYQVWQAKDLAKDPGWQSALKMIDTSPKYQGTTDEDHAMKAKDTLDFARTVHDKKLTGAQITTELYSELHPQEEALKQQKVKLLLDNVHQGWWNIISGGTSEGGEFRFDPTTGTVKPQATEAPEGTVVQVDGKNQVKRGGKWVPQ